jgi:hypothetical protein
MQKVNEHYEKLEVLEQMKRLMLDECREDFKKCPEKNVEKLKEEAKLKLEHFNNMRSKSCADCEKYLKVLKRREVERLVKKMEDLEEQERKLKELENKRMEELKQREKEYLESLEEKDEVELLEELSEEEVEQPEEEEVVEEEAVEEEKAVEEEEHHKTVEELEAELNDLKAQLKQ